MDTDLLTQFLQYVLGILPGHIAANTIAIITFFITFCTLILRFWKTPATNSVWYKIWKIIHLLASLKLPQQSIEKNTNEQEGEEKKDVKTQS